MHLIIAYVVKRIYHDWLWPSIRFHEILLNSITQFKRWRWRWENRGHHVANPLANSQASRIDTMYLRNNRDWDQTYCARRLRYAHKHRYLPPESSKTVHQSAYRILTTDHRWWSLVSRRKVYEIRLIRKATGLLLLTRKLTRVISVIYIARNSRIVCTPARPPISKVN